jgi:hypothetical protein
MGTIYALADPRTERIHHVGQTVNNPKRRATLTITGSENLRKIKWLKDLAFNNLRPVLIILEEAPTMALRDRERWWIAEMYGRGEPLTNSYDMPLINESVKRVVLPNEIIAFLQTIGDGDLSAGIKKLVQNSYP